MLSKGKPPCKKGVEESRRGGKTDRSVKERLEQEEDPKVAWEYAVYALGSH
jgi:hypothetical protein